MIIDMETLNLTTDEFLSIINNENSNFSSLHKDMTLTDGRSIKVFRHSFTRIDNKVFQFEYSIQNGKIIPFSTNVKESQKTM